MNNDYYNRNVDAAFGRGCIWALAIVVALIAAGVGLSIYFGSQRAAEAAVAEEARS